MHRPEGFGPSCLSSIAFSRYQLAMSDETAPTYCESKVRAGPNLAVKDGVLDGQLGERPLERLKSKVPLIARNQLRLAVLQERDRPKTVVFQFENVIGMVEAPAPDGGAWGGCEGAQFQSITAPLDVCAATRPPVITVTFPSVNGHIRREHPVVIILMWEVVYVSHMAISTGSRTYEERSKTAVTWITTTRP